MSKVFEKVRSFLFGEYEEFVEEDEVTKEEAVTNAKDYQLEVTDLSALRSQKKNLKSNNVIDINQELRTSILRVAPKSFEEVRYYIDSLKSKKVIVIDLANVKHDLAQRIMDFLGGAAYAIEGTIEKAGNDVFIVVHKNADISTSAVKEEYTSRTGALSWMASYK